MSQASTHALLLPFTKIVFHGALFSDDVRVKDKVSLTHGTAVKIINEKNITFYCR
jgi:hypothetical protein